MAQRAANQSTTTVGKELAMQLLFHGNVAHVTYTFKDEKHQ